MLVPFFLVYFRMQRVGREHLPRSGPLLLASNHRSFLDPFVIGTLVQAARLLHGQARAVRKALAGMDPERASAPSPSTAAPATATRWPPPGRSSNGATAWCSSRRAPACGPGRSATPRRGVGRLALETGAPVAPVAVIGTEDVRRGWRIRPRKVRLRVGRPLRFPTVERCSPSLAGAVTERIWACVSLQWDWLGGAEAPRRGAREGRGAARDLSRRLSASARARG